MEPSAGKESSPVLVVEDDALLQHALVQAVQRLGCHVRVAADAAQALHQAAGCVAAVVDLGLPPRPSQPDEGLRLVQLLAQRYPHCCVVVHSGQDEERSTLLALQSGAWDFVPKPAEPAVFAQVLRSALRRGLALRALARRGKAVLTLTAEAREGLREAADQAQERLLRSVMQDCGGQVAEAARRLGLERTRLYYYLDKFGLQTEATSGTAAREDRP